MAHTSDESVSLKEINKSAELYLSILNALGDGK